MSTKHRTIGASPTYAQVRSGDNQFHNLNEYNNGSITNYKAGSELNVDVGSTLTIDGIINVPSPTADSANAVPSSYVVPKATGGTFGGDIAIGTGGSPKNLSVTGTATFTNHIIVPSAAPTLSTHATPKAYVDSNFLSKTSASAQTITAAVNMSSSLTMTGSGTVTLPSTTPSSDYHAVPLVHLETNYLSKTDIAEQTVAGVVKFGQHPTVGSDDLQAATKGYVDLKLGNFEAGAGLAKTAGNTTGRVTSIKVTGFGANYTSDPTVSIAAPNAPLWQATTAVVVGDVIKTSTDLVYVVTTTGNTGATEPTNTTGFIFSNGTASLRYLGAAQQATASVVRNTTTNSVSYIYMQNMGLGYNTAPSVTISNPAVGGTLATATAYVNEQLAKVSVQSSTLNVTEDAVDLATVPTVTANTWYSSFKTDQYGRVVEASNDLSDVVASSTLTMTDGTINLSNLAVSSGADYYDHVKVDNYGRVTAGRQVIPFEVNDGSYNTLNVKAGRIISVTNIDTVKRSEILPIQIDSTSGITGTVTTTSPDSNGRVQSNIKLALNDILPQETQSFAKVNVSKKGLVVGGSPLTLNDITSALGYVPAKQDNATMVHLASNFKGNSWGTLPIKALTVKSGGITGMTLGNDRVFLPAGVYMIMFWGANNWYHSYYYNHWYHWHWWDNYWTYYYSPATIMVDGKVTVTAFANYGGWWWYHNPKYGSDTSQDFNLTDIVKLDKAGYVSFGIPTLHGVNFWYNIKIAKIG